MAWELSVLRGASERHPEVGPGCGAVAYSREAWAVGTALYCLWVAIFAFCYDRDEQWIKKKFCS